ncbi:MAG: hypothetical protein K8R46_04165, partial [Pirellulales bacterium]|nr:hypothetical protein [Pirellulales bacterium]
ITGDNGAPAILDIAGQVLTGNFAIEQIADANDPASKILTVAATDVYFGLNAGGNDIITLSNGEGIFIFTSDGTAGRIEGDVACDLDGMALAGSLSLAVNTTQVAVNEQFVVGTDSIALDLPAGPYLRIEGTDLRIELFGQHIAGDFSFEKADAAGPNGILGDEDDTSVIKIAAANIEAGIGDGTTDFASLENGGGLLVINAAGIAGRMSGTVRVQIPDVSLSGKLTLAVNNTGLAVEETFAVGEEEKTLSLVAGNYLRIEATGVEEGSTAALSIFGQTLSGNFSFEQITRSDGERLVKLAFTDVSLSLGGDGTPEGAILHVEVPNGAFLVSTGGMAGAFEASVTLNVDSELLSGELKFNLQVNTTGFAVNENFEVDGTTFDLSLSAGPFVRVEVTGQEEGQPAVINILGQEITGNFVFERVVNAQGLSVVRLGASDVTMNLAGVVLVSNGFGSLLISTAGIAGVIEADVAIENIPGVTFSGSFKLSINTTAKIVKDSITVAGKTLAFSLPSGPYLRVEGTSVILKVMGQSLSGDFAIESAKSPGADGVYDTADDTQVVRLGASNVHLGLGDGTTDFVSADNGQGAFIISSTGIAGTLSADVTVNIPGVAFAGAFTIAVNNTGDIVNETFAVGDDEINLNLTAGPYLRVDITGIGDGSTAELIVLGQTLSGNFSFEQSTTPETGTTVSLSASDVEVGIGDGTTDFVTVTGGEILFVVVQGGIYGMLEGDVAVNIPDVTFEGSFAVRINTTGTDQVVDDNGTDVVLANGFRIEGADITLDIAGQEISCDTLAIEKNADVVTLQITGFSLTISSGDDTLITVTSNNAAFVIDSLGLAASLDVTVDFSGINAISGITLAGGTSYIRINTRALPYTNESLGIDVPGGPYVRIEIQGLVFGVSSLELTGNFLFEQATRDDGTNVTRLAMSDVEFTYDPYGGVHEGTGAFIISTDGIAGFVAGKLEASFGDNLDAGADVKLRINSTPSPVDESIVLNGETITVTFTENEVATPEDGTFFHFIVADMSINLGGFVTIEGDEISFTNNAFSGSGLSVFMGQGPAKLQDEATEEWSINPDARGILLDNANVELVKVNGKYALYAEGTVKIIGISGVSFEGSAIVKYNGTGSAREFDVNGETVAVADGAMSFEGALDLNILEQTLSGTFIFEKAADTNDILFAVSNGELHLGGGAINLTGISGAFVFSSTGIAGT